VLVREVGVSVPETVKMLTRNPAKLLGLNKGTLEAGKDADIVVFDDEIQVQDIWVMGEKRS